MENFNKNEFGGTIKIGFNQDVSTATNLKIRVRGRYEDEIVLPATIGTVDTLDGAEKLRADEYIQCPVVEGLFKTTGLWRKSGSADIGSRRIVAADVLFGVFV